MSARDEPPGGSIRLATKDPGKKEWETVGNRNPDQAIAVARFANALAHPLRVQILQSLAEKEGSANTISKDLEVALGNVSYHLKKVLFAECGYVEVVRWKPVRGAREHFFRIDAERMLADLEWAAIAKPLGPSVQAGSLFAFAEQAVASLGRAVADEEQIGDADNGERPFATWRPGVVDERGWKDLRSVLVDANDRVVTVLNGCAERLAGRKGKPVIYGVGAFEGGDEG